MSAYPIYTIENRESRCQVNEGTTRNVHCLQQGGELKEFLSADEALAFWNEIKENITPRDGWKLYKLDKVKTCDL